MLDMAMRRPAFHTESARLGNRMAYPTPSTRFANQVEAPLESRHATVGEGQTTLPQHRHSNPPRLPSISQLLNEAPPTVPVLRIPEPHVQHTLKDSCRNHPQEGDSRLTPRRLPDPPAVERSPKTTSPEHRFQLLGSTGFQDRRWQLDHHDPGVSPKQQRNQEQVTGASGHDHGQDSRRQTWEPRQTLESFRFSQSSQPPSFDQVPRSSVPAIDSIRLSSAADIYAPVEASYSLLTPPYNVAQRDLGLRQDSDPAGSYPRTSVGHHHSRSVDYRRHPFQAGAPVWSQPVYLEHQQFPGHPNGAMFYAGLEHAPRQMGGRASADVPKKRPKLPPAFKLETRRWIDQHIWHPYPSKEFQQDLAARHGLEQKQVDFHFVNERRRYVVTQLERKRAIGDHAPHDLEARNQASPTVNASRSPDERYQRRYSGRLGRRGSRFSHFSHGSNGSIGSGSTDGSGRSKSS